MCGEDEKMVKDKIEWEGKTRVVDFKSALDKDEVKKNFFFYYFLIYYSFAPSMWI